ncbi:MAG TPA: 1-acyl-sn-glycerol-3-phosphate acyltransferase [Chitinophagaceae bacterium]|nr:1-acyl-sn-glycerol-3-phosphate acyltransferase [Chitinophagaceae bacterium]
MKIFKEIFARIWALWAIIVFIVPMLAFVWLYLVCFLLPEPKASRWHRGVSRVWMNIFLPLSGCPLKVRGKQHFEKGHNYVVVCNHNSLIDVPATTPFMPNANKTIAKKSFARVPLFGWIYIAGSILVDRNSDKSRRDSYEQMKQTLAVGLDMVIYPEGTRNRTGNPLKNFYDGAFRLAVETGKPIMPVVLFNTAKVLPVKKVFYMLPHKLEMHILQPVSSKDITYAQLKEKVFKIMWDYYAANK